MIGRPRQSLDLQEQALMTEAYEVHDNNDGIYFCMIYNVWETF
jgi:hypothetical protein